MQEGLEDAKIKLSKMESTPLILKALPDSL